MKTRSAAARLMASLLQGKGSLASLLPPALASLPERDRKLLQELCYGCSRYLPRLQCYLDLLLDKPLRSKDQDVQALLLLGLYQLEYMRVPDHAAISTAVSAAQSLKKPWAKGLINGVLRRYQREAPDLKARLEERAEFRLAHPRWLIDAITAAWPAQAGEIFEANNLHPPMALRVNQRRVTRDDYLTILEKAGIDATGTPYSAVGLTLSQARDVGELPHFADGWLSVQDEAAQLTAPLLQLAPGLELLDACCAPGGKTAHILESEDQIKLLGLDINPERLERSRATLDRLGLDAELLAADAARPEDWAAGRHFDRILLDAPCSATGVIRRHPDIKVLRRPEEIQRLTTIQGELLDALWPLLKPDGILLYATCSVLPAENSEVIAAFLDRQPDAQHETLDGQWGEAQLFGRQLLPSPGGHDGFYYARLRKRADR